MARTTRLLLIRHGESVGNVEQRITAEATCTGLSDLGRRQAAALAERFAAGHEHPVDVLYSSAIARAKETAEIVAPALGGLPLTIRPDLGERLPGDAEGLSFTEYRDRYGHPDEIAHPHLPMASGGESRAAFHYRVGRVLAEIAADHHGQSVAISCHGGVVDVALRNMLGTPINGAFEMWAINCALTEFSRRDDDEGKPGRWRLHRANDSAHLAGLPLRTERSS